MTASPSSSASPLAAWFQRASRVAAVLPAAAGALVLMGWAVHSTALEALLPGQSTMKPLTALALLFGGAALGLLHRQPAAGWRRRLGLLGAGAVAALGGLVLLEYGLGVNLGLDLALFRAAVLADPGLPAGRPAPATALCLLLLGLALLALAAPPSRRRLAWLAPLAAAAAGLVAGLMLLGYLYEVTALYELGAVVPMAPSTALAVLVLALGALAAQPNSPLLHIFSTPLAGGALSRRLLPAAIVLPVVLGWLRLLGQRRFLFDAGFGGALYAISSIVVFSALVYGTARLLNRADERREAVTAALRASEEQLRADIAGRIRVEAALRQSDERFEKAFRASPAALAVTRLADGLFVDVNDRFLELLGYARAEVIGQTVIGLGLYPDPAERQALVEQLHTAGPVRNRETTLLSKTGAPRSVLLSMDSIELGGEAHVLAILIDDTERRRADEALRQLNAELEARVAQRTAALAANEAKLRALFEVLPVGVSILDAQRRVLQSNPALGRIMQLSDESLAGGAYAQRALIRPDGSPLPAAEYASVRAFEEQRPVLNVENGVVSESGETIWLDVSAAPLPGDDQGVVVVSADITKRKQAEAALQAGEQQVRALLAQAQRQAQALTLRDRMHQALARELPLPEMMRALVQGIADTVGYSLVSLYLLDGDTLKLQHQVGYPQVIERISVSTGVMGRVARTGQAVLLEDVRTDPEFLGAIADITAEICVPLFESGQLAGVLNLESTHGQPLTAADLQLMLALGEQVDFALGRARLAAEARESQQRFASAFSHAPIGMALVAPDGRWLQVNPALCRLVGFAADELLRSNFQTITHPDDLESDLELVRQLLAGARSAYQMEKRFLHKQGRVVWTLLSVSLVRDPAGQPLYFISQIEDITERKAAEHALAAQAQALATERDLMQALMDNIPDTIYFKDTASRFTRINRAQAEYLRLPDPQAALGHTDLDFQEPAMAREIFDEEQRQVLRGRPLLNRIDQVSAPDGQPRWISSTKVPLRDAAGQVVGLVGISRDITALKQAEAQLLASLQEKSVLLKEIHHRVKNNLQVISSLLRLQADTLDDPRLRDAFEDSQRRVRTMALVHEQLYRATDLAHIDFGEYITGLVNYLRRSQAHGVPNLRVRVAVEAAIILEIDRAIPLGLLVNELVTNSLKYAFPAGSTAPAAPEIWVTAARDTAGALTVVVGDNGVGVPAELNLDQPANMGWQLVQSFVSQLHGQSSLQRQPGAVFTLTLPERKTPGG